MSQAVLHARKNGWLVVHIPRGWEQTCEGSFVEPATVPLPNQIVSNMELDILTSMEPILKPSIKNPLYYAAHSQLINGQIPSDMKKIEERDSQVFDNIFQSAVVLRGLYRAHAKELRNIPISYSNNNNNTIHYRNLYNQLNNLPYNTKLNDENKIYSSIDAFELLRKQFLINQDKIMSAPGRSNFNFIQIRELVEGEDNFTDQDRLDSDILLNNSGSSNINNKKIGFDMKTFQFKTLEDLLLFGIAIRSSAGSIFMHIIEELKLLNNNSYKILFAVDQYNTFDAPSAYKWNKKIINGQDLCVTRALYGINKKRSITDSYKINNGMFICATSHTHEEGRYINYYDSIKSIPLCIRVPNFNQVEYFAMMRYYATIPSKMTEFITLTQLLTYRMLCNSNPYEISKNLFLYFTSLGLNSFIEIDNFTYLAVKPTDNNIIAEEKRNKLQELETKFLELKKNFKTVV